MSFITRILGRNKPVWEKLFTPKELHFFYSEVENYFINRNLIISFDHGYVISKTELWKKDLRNLAQNCRPSEPNQWANIIESHFQLTERVMVSNQNLKTTDFSDVAELLVIRLWPEGTLVNVNPNEIIYRKELYGTISTLSLDLPDSILAVTPKMAQGWGKDLDELFKLGYKNVTILCKPNIIETDLGGSGKSFMITLDNNYLTSTHILLLEDHPECIGQFGALVSTPVRDIVVSHPLGEKQDLGRDALMMAYVTYDVCKNGPGSVSPYLYWYFNGNYETVDYRYEKQEITIPNRLKELMHIE